jgi:hypothetical protein
MSTNDPDDFSARERDILRIVVGHIIPASAAYGLPGADDGAILADILRSAWREGRKLHEAAAEIDAASGGTFATIPTGEQATVLQRFREQHPGLARACEVVTARCYYRDGRVMRSIGMEVRPPFPLGFAVEPSELDLLEPVRQRGKIYRDAN